MPNFEEERLVKYKELMNDIPVPADKLDAAILAGIDRAKKKEENQRSARNRGWFTVAAAAVILIGFFTSIRLSPAFAGYVSDIPGIGKIVDLIQFDKGLIAAFESEYDQEVGVTSESGGVTFTIDRAIADESGLALFYSIHSDKKQEEMFLGNTKLGSTDGSKISLASISSSSPTSDIGEQTFSGMIDFQFQKPTNARSFQLDVEVKGTKHTLDFTLKEKIHSKKEYNLNKTVTIEEQTITIETVTVYPLRAAVLVEMDDANSKKILNFDDIRLIDERGEVWGKIANGTTMTGYEGNENKKILYLQSNYFREPRELYLVLGKIQALDKDEAELVIDTETMTITKQPASEKFSNIRVENHELVFTLDTEKPFHFFPFSTIKSADGKEIDLGYSFSRGDNEFGFSLSQIKGNGSSLRLKLDFYPEWIESKNKIRIK